MPYLPQNVLSWSGRFGGGHTGWSQLQLASTAVGFISLTTVIMVFNRALFHWYTRGDPSNNSELFLVLMQIAAALPTTFSNENVLDENVWLKFH